MREDNEVVTTEALRAAALAASTRRGRVVSRRRIALRWLGWLMWRWVLPLMGLVTLLAALVALAATQLIGQAAVCDMTQTWLGPQFGDTKTAHEAQRQPKGLDAVTPQPLGVQP